MKGKNSDDLLEVNEKHIVKKNAFEKLGKTLEKAIEKDSNL